MSCIVLFFRIGYRFHSVFCWFNLCHFVIFLCFFLGFFQEEAVYGLTELHRDDVRNARLVANPGCYPTSIQLPLVPLVKVRFNIIF
jgi:hypothetical protein